MIKIKFSICPFIKVLNSLKDKKDNEKGGSVGIHVRWDSCRREILIKFMSMLLYGI